MTRMCFWQSACDWPVDCGAPSLHMYTHILSVSPHIALAGGVCDCSEARGSLEGSRWAHEGPGKSRFGLSFLGFFPFFSSGIFHFWEKLMCWSHGFSEELDEAVSHPLLVGRGTSPNTLMRGSLLKKNKPSGCNGFICMNQKDLHPVKNSKIQLLSL